MKRTLIYTLALVGVADPTTTAGKLIGALIEPGGKPRVPRKPRWIA